jgi:hypothetical protein
MGARIANPECLVPSEVSNLSYWDDDAKKAIRAFLYGRVNRASSQGAVEVGEETAFKRLCLKADLVKTVFAFAAAQPSPPKTLSTRILQVGYYVVLLITIATYTATLTSVLFSPAAQQPSVTAIDTPAGATICALAGTVMADVVTANGGNLVTVRA